MKNGLLQVATRKLHPATPSFFCPYALPYPYDPDASPPERFLQFLDELFWLIDDLLHYLSPFFLTFLTGAADFSCLLHERPNTADIYFIPDVPVSFKGRSRLA